MKTFILFFIILIISASCRRTFEAPIPNMSWDLFQSPGVQPLSKTSREKMEGVYSFTEGQDFFGDSSVLKWSYTANGSDTTFHLSIFCEQDVAYFICEGKKLDSSILLNGYWRKMVSTQTGKARFTISPANGTRFLLNNATTILTDSLIVTGTFGIGENTPDLPLRLKYNRPVYKATPYEIVAHRGGGRTSDLLPASENSVEMIKQASSYGATGVEIDVRLTSDGIPILFHDATLNERVIQKNGMLGPIENYSFAQLDALVRLEKGEHIPTLRRAMDAILYNTGLRFVWLDIKFNGSLVPIREIQKEYLQKAAAMGRTMEIIIGIPDTDVMNNFLKLSDFTTTPSVCELTPEDVEKTRSIIWGPRWTLGLQNEEVVKMHAKGRRAIVWTLDVPRNISEYMRDGKFDGILSNYPSVVAYYYYAKK